MSRPAHHTGSDRVRIAVALVATFLALGALVGLAVLLDDGSADGSDEPRRDASGLLSERGLDADAPGLSEVSGVGSSEDSGGDARDTDIALADGDSASARKAAFAAAEASSRVGDLNAGVLEGFLPDGGLDPAGLGLPVARQAPVQGSTESGAEAGGGSGSAFVEPAGLVHDALTGKPLRGLRVRATSFRGDENFEHAGTPALSVQEVETDSEGRFRLDTPYPSIGDLLLALEFSREGYQPLVALLAGRDGASGRFERVVQPVNAVDPVRLEVANGDQLSLRVPLRAAFTVPLRLRSFAGAAFAGIPVRVTTAEWSWSFLDVDPDTALGGRLTRPAEPIVLHSDELGLIHLPFSDDLVRLEILDPALHILSRVDGSKRYLRQQAFYLPHLEMLELELESLCFDRRRLVDREGRPLPGVELEVSIDGAGTVRTSTDDAGMFIVDVLPYENNKPAIAVSTSRKGRVRLLSAEYLGWTIDTEFPASDGDLVVLAEPSPILAFRCVVTGEPREDGEPVVLPAHPEGLSTSMDMRRFHASADGQTLWIGELPAAGVEIDIVLSGYLPRRVRIPDYEKGTRYLNLGDVQFDRGEVRSFQITGAPPRALASARLLVTRVVDEALSGDRRRVGDFLESHRFIIGADGLVQVGGVRRGAYHVGVEGLSGGIASWSESVHLYDQEIDRPFEIPLEYSADELVRVHGLVEQLDPLWATSFRVLEEFRFGRGGAWQAMPSYRLTRDGEFGSLRRLRGVTACRVTVLSPGAQAVTVLQKRGKGPTEFEFGALRLKRPPSGKFLFFAKGVGDVSPPSRVALEGENGSEVRARFRLEGPILRIDNLEMGQYVLRWLGEDGASEAFPFEVRNKFGGELEAHVERKPLPVECVSILVTNQQGEPFPTAAVRPACAPRELTAPVPGRPRSYPALELRAAHVGRDLQRGTLRSGEPTLVSAEVRTLGENELAITVDDPDYLDAHIELPAGVVVPRDVQLLRAVSAHGVLLDSAGDLAEGELHLSWEPIRPTPIRHGEQPVRAVVSSGRFEVDGLPSAPMDFTFRLSGSKVKVTRRLSLSPDGSPHDLGKLYLEETRSLRGIVRWSDGSPVEGAFVYLIDRDEAHRYPFRTLADQPRELRYRTRTDVSGQFEFSSLPVELAPELALVARAQNDDVPTSVVWPIDFESELQEMWVDDPTVLRLRVGYAGEVDQDRYRFALEYQEDAADPATRMSLGEIASSEFGLQQFTGVRPGQYRVTWRLREEYAAVSAIEDSILLPSGGSGLLRLEVGGEVLRGRARLNGRPLDSGWVLLTYNPGVNGSYRAGRIVDGEYEILDVPDRGPVWAVVLPDATPPVVQNMPRGEALPKAVPRYRDALRSGFLDLSYEAYDLKIRLDSQFLEDNPGLQLHYDQHVWDRDRFRLREGTEEVTGATIQFRMVEPRLHIFTFRSATGSLLRRVQAKVENKDFKLTVR